MKSTNAKIDHRVGFEPAYLILSVSSLVCFDLVVWELPYSGLWPSR